MRPTPMKTTATTLAILLAGTTTAFAQEAIEADTDGDGMVSLAELKELYADIPETELAAGFEQVDLDTDGLLNDDEIALARESGIFPPVG